MGSDSESSSGCRPAPRLAGLSETDFERGIQFLGVIGRDGLHERSIRLARQYTRLDNWG
jgi:hypothetical protein